MKTTDQTPEDDTARHEPAEEAAADGGAGAPRRYVFVCRGPECTERQSRALREHLRELVASRTCPGAIVSSYPCFGLCDQGPNALVYPDGVWYSGIQETDLGPIVDHLCGGPVHQPRHFAGSEELTETTFENIQEILGPRSARPKRFSWWPFGRRHLHGGSSGEG